MTNRCLAALVALSILPASAHAVSPVDPPAAADSFAPQLVATASGAAATWIERLPAEGDAAPRHRVRFARFVDDRWHPPVTVVESEALFANWADMPGVAAAGDGALVVWWLERNGESTYAYGVRLARSGDEGATWTPLGWLHDDLSPTEHGFVSMAPAGDGLRAFWLDGRETLDGRPMTLRTALVDETVGASELVDEAVCDCCSTAAVSLDGGALVAYRDRSAEEIRDIRVAAVKAGERPRSTPAAEDGWRIEGCPVNGPALVRAGDHLAVAWFTAPADRGRVSAAFSVDGGASFSPPLVVDDAQPIGRVTLAALGDGDAALAWHARSGERAEIRVARLSPASGAAGSPLTLATTSGGRRSGFARLAALADGRLLVAWTDAGEGPTRLRASLVERHELPGP